jgi:hypothetical protein
LPIQSVQDPGKDLFAYLFLLMMVFSFMLLMTMDEKQKKMPVQTAPDQETSSSRSAMAVVPVSQVGLLGKKDGNITLFYGDTAYNVSSDLEQMTADGRFVVKEENGQEVKLLYVREDLQNKLLLEEYFIATKELSEQGIRVVFVE